MQHPKNYLVGVPVTLQSSSTSGPAQRDPLSHAEGAQPAILLVDDDPGVLQVVSKVLRRIGCRVWQAGGGAEALELVASMEEPIDLLLTDVAMPGMGGRELSEAIAARVPGVRILFMSGYSHDEILLQGVRAAEVNFISKPFTMGALRAKVLEVTGGNG